MTVLHGDCLELLRLVDSDSIDSIVTDPPYGLNFLGRDWDKALPDPAIWSEALRVAKPGAHLVCFGAPKCYHRIACHVEDAGWELRDSLMWLYGSGFPKSHNVAIAIDKRHGALAHRGRAIRVTTEVPFEQSALQRPDPPPKHEPITDDAKRWTGWGTALKPAYEPILLARKPFGGTVAENVMKHGTGALNIDGCRIAVAGGGARPRRGWAGPGLVYGARFRAARVVDKTTLGRWPANLVLDEGAAEMLDEQSGKRPVGGGEIRASGAFSVAKGKEQPRVSQCHGDTGGASRFFYVPKASRSEREAGLDDFVPGAVNDGRDTPIDNPYQRGDTMRKCLHPTVKPIALMRWLVRLVTPPGGLVLDPFAGSGTTGCAAAIEGFRFVGMELDEDHVALAQARIAHWAEQGDDNGQQRLSL